MTDRSRLIHAALSRVVDPEIRKPITELDMVGAIEVAGSTASVDLKLTIVGCPAADTIERDVRAAVLGVEGIEAIDLTVGVMSREQRDALTARLKGNRTSAFGPDSLTRVVCVTSGKGGVGKSSLTAGLAVSLAQSGLRVGLMDADVFGFSIPGLLGIPHAKPTRVGELILPPVAHGVKVISIGMFTEPGTAVSWRGPMLHRTMQQFLTDVFFGDLDVLLIDLPPGTGDVAISLGQLLPQAEVLVVTTPQAAAADVAERSAIVARQTGQTVIGVVENMAGLVQPDGSVLDVFGAGGGEAVASRLDVPLLGSIPLSVALREGGDSGMPVVLANPDDPAARAITELAATVAGRGRGLAGRKLGLSVT
ncbi:ATP-binding protein involved in chromosome partitioning [Microbacteriaceae bacterium SG_E_30_P1]|uniref:Iron-sulfur cluster carrier protein n=1 Tax=Antiquaquibacter oligotrophicus TaxID=2880260 RepID=A0ABT6KL15_9MICO|nr:P-loop NTPase [Antiquaquibacter oligotrophicus]MDH6180415.1 ATP-binding protein involved in chromosome partitioning [Antiquaquibacter oligotrophicus]UDF13847.1 Mrp/NBP35 family ATP-binding protein [Antiquaquibacter oligotrophicus]